MLNSKIIRQSHYNGSDAVFEVSFGSTDSEKITRVYLISNEGVSRHIDFKNMEKCCSGELLFDRDAFFFRSDDAIDEARTLLNCEMINDYFTKFLNNKIKMWEN